MNKLIRRKNYLDQLAMWREEKMIKVVTGVRRCGKSTLFELYIGQLKAGGVSDDQIIFINLEDEEFSVLLDHRKLHEYVKNRILKDRWTYVFLDEIQNCKNYEKAVSSLYLKKNLDIYLTGSNAYMLSGELATRLTARYIEIDMLPLSFKEYSEAVKIHDKRECFNNYLNMGAFPYAARFADNSLAHSQYFGRNLQHRSGQGRNDK
jgi:predicted AAA+ superfamily ATPase